MLPRVRIIRRIVLAIVVVGIAGMIVSSIANENKVALGFGLVTALAVLCSMVATAVTSGGADDSEVQAARVESLSEDLVAAGADQRAVRALVREAVRLGRITGGGSSSEAG
ncbi:MAG: hypothetical protein ACLGHT_05395 [Acidimicrobiia bacterium]